MTLTVLVGNTNARLTRFRGARPAARRVIPTARFLSDPGRFLARPGRVTDAGLASVRAGGAAACRPALERLLGRPPVVVGPRSRTGLVFRYDRSQLGADRVCAAVGARLLLPGRDLVVLDFGTAVTVNVIDRRGCFLGGLILPGYQAMVSGLLLAAPRLPRPASVRPRQLLGRDTSAAVRAGVWHTLVGGIERILDRIDRQAGSRFETIATGGGYPLVRSGLPRVRRYDADLAARGLAEITRLNRRPG